jgi:GTPase SAR1 family protein
MGAARTETQRPPSGRPPRLKRFRVKVITMGAAGVGKSALLQRYVIRITAHTYLVERLGYAKDTRRYSYLTDSSPRLTHGMCGGRYCNGDFSRQYVSTVGVSHCIKGVRLGPAEVREPIIKHRIRSKEKANINLLMFKCSRPYLYSSSNRRGRSE